MFSFMNPGKSKPAKKGLKIIIVGCGKVGTTLVEQLSKEGHDIIIIDKNAKKVQEIANIYDIMGIVGNGASYSVQMDAGIEDTDLIISVTESDELNLLCCTVAKQVGDCAAIARVRTPDYSHPPDGSQRIKQEMRVNLCSKGFVPVPLLNFLLCFQTSKGFL